MEEKTYTITDEIAGGRLDQVAPEFVGETRSQVHKAIKAGLILLNGKQVTPHKKVREGDVVTWTMESKEIEMAPNREIDIPVLFEDDTLLVIDKPVGIVVHQGGGHTEPDTIANWLLAHTPAIKDVGPDALRPGIVHRLDRDVSGVMVITKTQEMYETLVDQFSRGVVDKEYAAFVYGHIDNAEGVIDFPLARSKHKGKIAARPKESAGDAKNALTHYETVEAGQHYSHLRVMPKTGRMHQIRAHLAAIDHAIVGDTLYATKEQNPDRAKRLYLHAMQLSFDVLDGSRVTYTSKLPGEFEEFLSAHL
jgi:23S rRNA pseudouridine1911/1915/1917 synthase